MKKNIGICLVLALLLVPQLLMADAGANDVQAELDAVWNSPDSTVVGTVDGAAVTKGELAQTIVDNAPDSKGELTQAMWNSSASSTLRDLLTQVMVEQAAKSSGIRLSQAELDAKGMEAVKRMNLKSVDELLKQFHVTRERFVSSIRMSAYAEKAAKQTLEVTDADIAGYIRARHILLQFPAAVTDQTAKEDAARAKAQAVLQRLSSGEDFAKLADECSDDPGSAKNGGDLGWFTRGRMMPDFEKAAYSLSVGQVSAPVKTPYGYHIIRLDATGSNATAQQKAEIRKNAMDEKLPKSMQKWFMEVQAKARIYNRFASSGPGQPVIND